MLLNKASAAFTSDQRLFIKQPNERSDKGSLVSDDCCLPDFVGGHGFGHGFGFGGYGGYGHKVSVFHFINKTALCLAKGTSTAYVLFSLANIWYHTFVPASDNVIALAVCLGHAVYAYYRSPGGTCETDPTTCVSGVVKFNCDAGALCCFNRTLTKFMTITKIFSSPKKRRGRRKKKRRYGHW